MKVIITFHVIEVAILAICFVVSKIINRYNNVKVDVTKRMRNINVVFHYERKAINIVKGGLKLIPVYILKKFDDKGYTMHVLDKEAFKAEESNEDVVGYHWAHGKVIVILFDAKSECSEYYYLVNTICHEFGHFIDHCYPTTETISSDGTLVVECLASQRQDIQDAFESAKCLYADDIGSYYLSSSCEFFAYLSANYFTKAGFVEKQHKVLFKEALATTFERAK